MSVYFLDPSLYGCNVRYEHDGFGRLTALFPVTNCRQSYECLTPTHINEQHEPLKRLDEQKAHKLVVPQADQGWLWD